MFIKLENLRVHYKVIGHGKPLILIHGWGGDINYFSKLKSYLSEKYTVYVLDLPGFGLSSAPDTVWGSADYADLVKKFVEASNIKNPVIVGHSFGGKIAIHLAGDGLIDVDKMVLISSSGVKLPRSFMVNLRIYFFKLLKLLSNLPIIRRFVEPRLDIYRKRVGSTDYKNAKGIMRKILVKTVNDSIVRLLSKIKVPVLLLWGDKDDAAPLKGGQIMDQSISDSRLKVIAGSGHFPFLDNWEKVKLELDDFLN